MFVKNLEEDFYKTIQGSNCLLLVNFDVDAICASRILQQLFKNDRIVYTLVPVQGIQDMIKAFKEEREQIKHVIMINCGGTLDIVESLVPPESVIFFILDSHRPYDLCNVYSENQIRILGKPDAEDNIPEYHDVFRDDSSEEEDEINEMFDSDADSQDSHRRKRRRLNEEDLDKRRERRLWTENRDTILFNYSQYSYYGRPSSLLIFEMAFHMSKDNLDMAWWAIVGFTEQVILGKVESRIIVLEEGRLQSHISRLTHKQSTDAEKQQTIVKITYDKDLQLALYRHWTVEASLRHSISTAVLLRLWSVRGEQRLKEVLAEMGLPLAQSRQRFCAMDLTLRQEFKQMVEKLAQKHDLKDVLGTSFVLQYGYRFKYCASDVAYAMLAEMECSRKDKLPKHCFLDAMDCLSRTQKAFVENGIEKAKQMLTIIFKAAQSILEMKNIMSAGSFLYITVPDGISDNKLFSHPHALIMLAQFTLKAYANSSRSKRAHEWPLIASAICNEENHTCLVVGIPPVCEDQPRSLFGRAFEQAAKNANIYIDADYFDSTIIRLKIKERPKFFDALAALLM